MFGGDWWVCGQKPSKKEQSPWKFDELELDTSLHKNQSFTTEDSEYCSECHSKDQAIHQLSQRVGQLQKQNEFVTKRLRGELSTLEGRYRQREQDIHELSLALSILEQKARTPGVHLTYLNRE